MTRHSRSNYGSKSGIIDEVGAGSSNIGGAIVCLATSKIAGVRLGSQWLVVDSMDDVDDERGEAGRGTIARREEKIGCLHTCLEAHCDDV